MNVTGYSIDAGFIKDHTKVVDLIVYDGPILSHFKADHGEDFLYYWIDEVDGRQNWLIFKVNFYNLREYLSGMLSLGELILSKDIQYYFVADHNFKSKAFENLKMVDRGYLSDDFLPENDSYYIFEIPPVYREMLTDKVINQVEYVQLLKEKAIFIKFSEIDSRHRHVVSIDNLTGYLSNLKKSYNNYVEESFKKNFLQLFSNLTDLNKAVDRIQENLQLRIVDAKIASFGIGLSADTMSLGDDMRREVKEWSSGIVEDYNNEVIGLDYSQADNLNEIMKTYSPEARKKIFKPILDIYADKSVEVSVSVKNLNSVKKVNKPNKQSIKNLVEISQEVTPIQKEKEFVTIAVEVEKGADLNKIPKKVFSSQPLFERRSDTIELTKTALQYENVTITFKSPLVLNVVVKDGVHVITSDQLGIATENVDINNGLKILTSIIYNCWLTFLESNVSVKEFQNVKGADPVTKLVAGLIEAVEEQK